MIVIVALTAIYILEAQKDMVHKFLIFQMGYRPTLAFGLR